MLPRSSIDSFLCARQMPNLSQGGCDSVDGSGCMMTEGLAIKIPAPVHMPKTLNAVKLIFVQMSLAAVVRLGEQ